MKYLLAQPGCVRFQWELDVCLTNLCSLNDEETPIVVLLTEDNPAVVEHFKGRYPNVEVHSYPDERDNKSYAATTRPYLCWRYFGEDPARQREIYFQIDCDVIFRELPDFAKILQKEDGWKGFVYGSDCGGYIDYNYLRTRENGEQIVAQFAEQLNIPVQLIKETPGAGAQWLIGGPTAQLWWHIWQDSQILYNLLQGTNSNIQKWTAEMWAQLYNLAKFGYRIETTPELDFCRPTDDIKMWDMVKILHNAGVVGEGAAGLFFKGKYETTMPFGEDLSWVRRDRCSIKYVEAIKKVVLQ